MKLGPRNVYWWVSVLFVVVMVHGRFVWHLTLSAKGEAVVLEVLGCCGGGGVTDRVENRKRTVV